MYCNFPDSRISILMDFLLRQIFNFSLLIIKSVLNGIEIVNFIIGQDHAIIILIFFLKVDSCNDQIPFSKLFHITIISCHRNIQYIEFLLKMYHLSPYNILIFMKGQDYLYICLRESFFLNVSPSWYIYNLLIYMCFILGVMNSFIAQACTKIQLFA